MGLLGFLLGLASLFGDGNNNKNSSDWYGLDETERDLVDSGLYEPEDFRDMGESDPSEDDYYYDDDDY